MHNVFGMLPINSYNMRKKESQIKLSLTKNEGVVSLRLHTIAVGLTQLLTEIRTRNRPRG
jgi:hypothetical protein